MWLQSYPSGRLARQWAAEYSVASQTSLASVQDLEGREVVEFDGTEWGKREDVKVRHHHPLRCSPALFP